MVNSTYLYPALLFFTVLMFEIWSVIGYDVSFYGGSDMGFGAGKDYINDLWVRDQLVPPDQATCRPGVHSVWSSSSYKETILQALDYSDDEKEKESKKKKKKTQMKQGVEQTVLNKNDEEPMQYRWQHQTPPREGRGYQGWGNNSLSQQEGFPNSAGRGCSLSRGLFNPNSNRPFRPSGFPPHYSRMMPPRPPPPHFYDQGNFMLPCPYPPPFQHPGPNRMPPFPPPPHMRMHWPNHEMGPPPPLHNVPFQPPHPPYPGCHFTPQN